MRILLVDDEQEEADLARRELLKLDECLELICAGSARQALEFLEREEVDCILADYQMPGVNGLQLLERIRSDGADTPFVLLTGRGNEALAATAFRAGADDYYVKGLPSVGFDKILNGIKRAVQARRRRRELEEALKLSEARYQLVVESVSECICILDREGRFALANAAAESVFGSTVEALHGRSIFDFLETKKSDRIFADLDKTPPSQPCEAVIKRLDGENRTLLVSTAPLATGDGEGGLLVAVMRDITERKQTEEALRTLQERYKTVSELTSDYAYFFEISPDGTQITKWVSGAFTKITGYEVEEAFVPNFWMNIIHRDDMAKVREWAHKVFLGKGSMGEFRIVTKSGEEKWIFDSGVPMFDESGRRPIGVMGASRDVTDRKLAEEALKLAVDEMEAHVEERTVELKEAVQALQQEVQERKRMEAKLRDSEERFRSIFDNATIGLYRTTPGGRILLANPSLTRMLGYDSFDDLAKRNLEEEGFEPEYPRSQFKQEVEEKGIVSGLVSVWTRRDGSTLYIRESARVVKDADGEVLYYEGTVEDITEQKRAEKLTEIQRDLGTDLGTARDIDQALTLARQAAGRIEGMRAVGVYRAVQENAGLSLVTSDGVDGLSPKEKVLFEDDDFERVAVTTGKPVYSRVDIPDSDTPPGSLALIPVRVDSRVVAVLKVLAGIEFPLPNPARGTLESIASKISGVIAMLEAEEALRRSEERYRKIVETAGEGVWIIDLEGRTQFVNPRVSEMLGYPAEELIGRYIYEFMDDEGRASARESLKDRSNLDNMQFDFKLRRKDGSDLWVIISTGVITDEAGENTTALGMLTDITERKKSESELRAYQQKLKSLASELTLVAERERRNIAVSLHDRIGHALDLAKFKVFSLKDKCSEKECGEVLAEVVDALNTALRETRSLTIEISPPSLHEFGFVAAAESLVRRFNDEYGISFEFTSSADKLPLSDTLSIMLYRSLRELMVNVIKHSNAKRCEVDIAEDGEQVIISVRDNGRGLDQRRTIADISVSKGFGLFSVKEHLESFGGSMSIGSTSDEGTEVTLKVPLSADKQGGENG